MMSGRLQAPHAATLLGLTASLIVVGLSLRKQKKSDKLRRKILWLLRLYGGSFELQNLRCPVGVLPAGASATVDEDGFVECNIKVKRGKIVSVATGKASRSGFTSIDCQGCVVMPCFSDAHTHMVKTEIVPRLRNKSGTVSEALEIETYDQPRWKVGQDVARRMTFAVECAMHYGTRAIRTHLDGTASDDPEVQAAVYSAFDRIRDKYKDKVIVQGVANLFLPLWLTPMANAHADRAKTHANVVLGAYVPAMTAGDKPVPDTVKALDALFEHAMRLDMDCDMHIDETNEPSSCGLASLCESLAKARKKGYKGKVVLGHCCALSLQSKETQDRICKRLGELQAYVVSNPFTNLGLQDRQGTKNPDGRAIPSGIARTPQWRGLTLLQELRGAGVVVAAASDNVRDHWYPYGDYDMMTVWSQVQAMGHLDTFPFEGSWADVVSDAAAEAMGIPFGLSEGEPADLVLFPSARRASELFARPQTDRIVLRKGIFHNTTLPDFSELDDLIAIKTEKGTVEESTLRNAL